MSLDRLLAIAALILLAPWGESHAQGGAGAPSKIRSASFESWEAGPFDPPVLSPAAPWRRGQAPMAARGPRTGLRDGALGSAALAVGEFQWEATDLVVPGRGLDFVLARKYRSKSKERGVLGPGWTHAYELRLERVGPDLLLHDGWGRRDLFERNPDDTYTATGWFALMSEEPDGTVRVRLGPFANEWHFADPDEPVPTAGKLERIEDAFGNALTFAYDGSGDLNEVTDTLGRAIVFVHDAQGRLTSVTDFAGRSVRYDYYDTGEPGGSAGDLRGVTSPDVTGTPTGNDFPAGKTTTYAYTQGRADERENHNLRTIVKPDGALLVRNRYGRGPTIDGPRNWLEAQWLAPDAHETQFHYVLWADSLGCIVNDEAGNVREYTFDARRLKLRRRSLTGRADPDTATTPNTNRPQAPLRPGEAPFLTTWFVNPDGSILLQRDQGGGEVRSRFYRYVGAGVDRVWQRNLLQVVHGDVTPGGTTRTDVFLHDPVLGVLTHHVRPGGQTTRYLRDPVDGTLTSIVYAEPGVSEDFEYNAFGQLTAHVHPDNGDGQRQRDEYVYFDLGPSTGYLRGVVENADHAPGARSFAYDAVGHRISSFDALGRLTQFDVNALGQTVRVRHPDLNPNGNTVSVATEYAYDVNDDLVEVLREDVDEDGVVQGYWDLVFAHDARGRRTSVSRTIGPGQEMITNYEFLTNGLVMRLPRTGEGIDTHVVTEEYDERGLLFRRTRGVGHPTDASTTQWDYDAFGAVVRRRGPLEGADVDELLQEWDVLGDLVSRTDAMGNVWTYGYTANGDLASARLEGELVDVVGSASNVLLRDIRLERDGLGRVVGYAEDWFDTATQEPVHTGHYNFLLEIAGTGAVTRLSDANGEDWTWNRDLATRRVTRTDPLGQTLRETRDVRGNLTERLETIQNQLTGAPEAYPTTLAYDAWDRVVERRDRQQNAWRTTYDTRSLPIVETGPSGRRTERSFDGRGLLLEERVDLNGNGATTDSADRRTTYTHDLAGNRTSRTDDNGNLTGYRYDSLDRHFQTIHADLTSWTRTYDPSDDPVQLVDGNGTVVAQQFDLLGRLTTRTIQPGSGVSSDVLREDYAYDGHSRLVQASDEDTNVLLAYSSLGHVLRESQNGFTTTSDYDARGNLVSCTYPNGRLVTYANDALGRVTSVREGAAGPVTSTLLYSDDQVARRTLANGVRTDYEFNGIGNAPGDLGVRQLERARHEVVGGTVLSELEWAYRGDQSPTDLFDGRLFFEHDFLHDSGARLMRWDRSIGMSTEIVQYALDGEDNRIQVAGGPDAGSYFMNAATPIPADRQQNQYSTTPFDARRYDETGNPTDWSDADFVRELTYDYRGRLVEWSDAATGIVHRYTYDPLDRMTSHIRDATGTVQRVVMHYRQHQRIEEFATALTTYTYEGEAEHPFERRDGTAELYYLRDREHTVRALMDETAGVVEYYDYDPFGIATVRDGAGMLLGASAYSRTPLFRGMRWHEELGLYRNARGFHDPRVGRPFDGAAGTVDDREPGLPGVTIYSDLNRNSAGAVNSTDLNSLGVNWQPTLSKEHPDFAWIPTANGLDGATVGSAQSLSVGASQADAHGGKWIEILPIFFPVHEPGTPVPQHEDEIDLQSTSWLMSRTDSPASASPRRVPFEILSFEFGAEGTAALELKPVLIPWYFVPSGADSDAYELEPVFIKSYGTGGGSPAPTGPAFQAQSQHQKSYYKWQLQNAKISSYSISASGGAAPGFILGRFWNDPASPPHFTRIFFQGDYDLAY